MWLAASNETLNRTEDLVGASEVEVAIIVTSFINQVDVSDVSLGLTMSSGRKQLG